MTEADWLSGTDAGLLLRFIEPKTSNRKLHLFAVACARRIAPLLIHYMSLYAVDVIEQFADGLCGKGDFIELDWDVEGAAFAVEAGRAPGQEVAERLSHDVLAEFIANPALPVRGARETLTSAAYFVDAIFSDTPWERRVRDQPSLHTPSAFRPVSLVHEVFGNPFRVVKFRRAWRTSTVMALARQMYESRDFAPMPILADALQDAGCEDEQVLSHCRSPGPHVRGCWVIDQVLVKK